MACAAAGPPRVRLGSRRSALALRQTDVVAQRLAAAGCQCPVGAPPRAFQRPCPPPPLPQRPHNDGLSLPCGAVVVWHCTGSPCLLACAHPLARAETMDTLGDKVLHTALSKIASKGLFTKELEVALVDQSVDAVVHSLKDLPTALPEGLVVAAILAREDPRDVVVFHPSLPADTSLAALPSGSIVGTSSVRRVAQLRAQWPHLVFRSVRGNLNTRFRKLDTSEPRVASTGPPADAAGHYAALVLAAAGLHRMGLAARIGQVLDPQRDCLYAVGQGAVAVECRAADAMTKALLLPLHDRSTALRCAAERAVMRALEGGCSVPLGVDTELNGARLHITAGVFSVDGGSSVRRTVSNSRSWGLRIGKRAQQHPLQVVVDDVGTIEAAVAAGERLAVELLDAGKRPTRVVYRRMHALRAALTPGTGAGDILAAIPRVAV